MAKNSIFFILVLIGFICCNSCKKEKNTNSSQILNDSCNTVPDCQVIGRYLVTMSLHDYDYSHMYSYDTDYGNRIITLTELEPGVIRFIDTSYYKQLYADYDTQSRADFPVFSSQVFYSHSSSSVSIALSGGDTISVTDYNQIYPGIGSYTYWHGARVH